MRPFVAAFNHVLAQNAWAQAQLSPYTGKTFQLRLLPAAFNLTLDASGAVRQATEGMPDVTLIATPSGFLRYLSTQPRDVNLIHIEGDAEFGAALRDILSQITWEAEEDLSHLVGDVLAHRITGFAKNWLSWRERSVKAFALSASEYFNEEQALLAKPYHLAQFALEVTAVENAVNDLDKRIQKLANHR